MRIDILTLFPDMIGAVLGESVTGRALKKNLFELNLVDIRDYTLDKHRRVDDYPYGGGDGMVMQAEPVYNAYNAVKSEKSRFFYLTPHGKTFNQAMAKELSEEEHLIFLCGHYEGIDQRVIDLLKPEEISLGDFILTGGELAVMPVCDSILRLLPGVLGNETSMVEESFENNLLEYPQYTRPEEFMEKRVPEVLLSGHHKNIEDWRREKSLEVTLRKRPDLLKNAELSKKDKEFLEKLKKSLAKDELV
ncbi:MAG: tRNA (guanosine(37)-N1)-methyltransferase TrmD [Ruminococcaceae bacterium]|nr:tRNA (guanosine(37)-N1)-methyltransferase TrmD [Oscillospiraceae bacterium]